MATLDPKSRGAAEPDYAVGARPKLKRIGLASFLSAIAACISVALIGIGTIFIYTQINSVFPDVPSFGLGLGDEGFMSGAGMATLMAALNWYVGYITIPVAWLVLALALGRLPRRAITQAGPYYRRGAIWGGILVGGTTTIATALLGGAYPLQVIGALFAGVLIGALAGLVCGWLFRAIVRPAEQVARIEVDVF